MHRRPLGTTGIEVSAWSLGTMTWGRQTGVEDAHHQMDAALDHGIDFVDTAEMYPVNPVKPETVGDTEAIIGDWVRKTGRRGEIVLATKCSGPTDNVRSGAPISPETLRAALDGSLTRLATDHVDLYQLHWPNRGSYHFRQNWGFDPTAQDTATARQHIADVSGELGRLRDEGKIRAFGLSNDTAWGVTTWQRALAEAGAPPVATLQNEYSLLARNFDTDLAEACHHEDVTLFAYSPLACGLLTGKYRGGVIPEGSRRSINESLNNRVSERCDAAIAAYLAIALRHGLDPVHMALAWVAARPVPTIPIFGATSMAQLRHILDGIDTVLPDDVMAEIDATHRAYPMPY